MATDELKSRRMSKMAEHVASVSSKIHAEIKRGPIGFMVAPLQMVRVMAHKRGYALSIKSDHTFIMTMPDGHKIRGRWT